MLRRPEDPKIRIRVVSGLKPEVFHTKELPIYFCAWIQQLRNLVGDGGFEQNTQNKPAV